MEKRPPKPMTPFDELVTPTFVYTLKLLLPYVPPTMQRTCAIFLKFFELRQTMELFFGFNDTKRPHSSGDLINELKPYMDPKEKEMMEQMEGMMNMMEMMQMMQNASPPSSRDEGGGVSPFDLMKGMMDPEQQQMFDMYSNIFEQAMDSPESDNQKGDEEFE